MEQTQRPEICGQELPVCLGIVARLNPCSRWRPSRQQPLSVSIPLLWVDKSFETILEVAGINQFRFHDLRHTFASWYMMNGGDLYELAKILGHSNIKMTERYAKLAKAHIAKTGSTAREMWRLMEGDLRRQALGTA